jgi:FAD:protein FMN transferase
MHETSVSASIDELAPHPLSRRQILSPGRLWSRQPDSTDHQHECVRISRTAMACSFEVIVASEFEPVAAAQMCLDEVDRLESTLSVFRPGSEITRLNRIAGERAVQVSHELFALLELCSEMNRETEGTFDCAMGGLTQCWGFDKRRPVVPEHAALSDALRRSGFDQVLLGPDRCVSFRSSGVRLNFGAIGKGYALDRCAAILGAWGVDTALMNAGASSVVALGDGMDRNGWLVGLRHPVFKSRRLAMVRLSGCSMATSGQEEQSFEYDGRRYGHILDPRTGTPAQGVLSVSVFAESGARADALATAFFVGGVELAKTYCKTHPDVTAIFLLQENLFDPVVVGSGKRIELEVMSD